jgi:hypothetical protein
MSGRATAGSDFLRDVSGERERLIACGNLIARGVWYFRTRLVWWRSSCSWTLFGSGLVFALSRARTLIRPRVQRGIERFTGAIMIGFGLRLVTEALR